MDRIRLLFLLIFVFVAGTNTVCDTPKNKPYFINWLTMELMVSGTGYIVQKGSGNPIEWQYDATLDAKKDLLKNFFLSMRILRLDAYDTARDFLMREPVRNEAIYHYTKSVKKSKITYGENAVTITKHFPFFGKEGMASLFIEPGIDTGSFPLYDEFVFATTFTGLVIDGRGLKRIPALSPRIFDEDHNRVYSADLVKRESFERWGVVQYTNDPSYRGYESRVGENPLKIVAIENDKLIATDLAISNEDAMILLLYEETKKNLEDGRVIIIIDSL